MRAYRKASELEVSLDDFDQSPTTPRVKYVLCATPRSGSFLLCRQLINAGLGVPHEYYNPLHFRYLCARWGLPDEPDVEYHRELYRRRTTPNGVWGSKLHWPQLVHHRAQLEAELDTIEHYIYLFRSDAAAQAVSLHLSALTGKWGFDGTVTAATKPEVEVDDLDHIGRCFQALQNQNRSWRLYFAERGIKPLVVPYEVYVADQPAGNRRIAQYLGVKPDDFQVPLAEPRTDPYSPELEATRERVIRLFRERSRGTDAGA